jgi:uncharacterized membrane protein
MIEIIPNWHPIFVHFTIGLLAVSALFYLAGAILKKENLLVAARWNLWVGALVTVGTALAGWYAYNTVNHDGPSHIAMTGHRNWALTTAATFILLALWAFRTQHGAKTVSPFFVAMMLAATGLLAVTGYKGGEAVYRHGLGVMRLPAPEGHGHDREGHKHEEHGHHDHGDEHEQDGHEAQDHSDEHGQDGPDHE